MNDGLDELESLPERVAVLGGTFDPVHLGHLHAAEQVYRVFPLSRVLLVPCAVPPHKHGRALSPANDRVAMLRLAAQDHPWLEVDTREIERGGVSFTIDTLREIASSPPARRPLFVLGIDALREIDTWKDYRELLREFDLVAVDRPEEDLVVARRRLPEEAARRLVRWTIPDAAVILGERCGGRIFYLPIPPLDVSSSEIRRRSAHGERLDGLVPPAVDGYIRRRNLYRQEGSR